MTIATEDVDQILDRVNPSAKELQETDHGRMNLGDIIVIVLDLVLFIYTAYRSWHFLSLSMPAEYQFLALIGLWGLDLGMIAWSLVWIYGSTTQFQNWASITMFVLDLLGVMLTSVVDTLMYADDANAMPPILSTIAWYGIPIIIIGNVLAGFLYHMTSPATRRARAFRKQDEEMARQKEAGELKLRKLRIKLEQAQHYSEERAKVVVALQSVSRQNMALSRIEKRMLNALNTNTGGEMTGEDLEIKALLKDIDQAPSAPISQPEPGSYGQATYQYNQVVTQPPATQKTPPVPASQNTRLDLHVVQAVKAPFNWKTGQPDLDKAVYVSPGLVVHQADIEAAITMLRSKYRATESALIPNSLNPGVFADGNLQVIWAYVATPMSTLNATTYPPTVRSIDDLTNPPLELPASSDALFVPEPYRVTELQPAAMNPNAAAPTGFSGNGHTQNPT